ncbi:hypothetical protein D030_1914B, partial [Vibrio parahaemolyticus AQ3810]
ATSHVDSLPDQLLYCYLRPDIGHHEI